MTPPQEINILKKNVNELQQQLQEAYKRIKELSDMVQPSYSYREISTYWANNTTYYSKEPPTGYCKVWFNAKEELFGIDWYNEEAEKIASQDFPGKSIHFVESAAENWSHGVKDTPMPLVL